jgi:hypothetical protein
MNTVLLLFLCVTWSSCIFCGILLYRCHKAMTKLPQQRLSFLKDVTSIASQAVEQVFPGEHPVNKKKRAEAYSQTMLQELGHSTKEHFTIDSLLSSHMQAMDTDARMTAIRGHMADHPTQRDIPAVRLQNTPSMGMRQVARRRTGGAGT